MERHYFVLFLRRLHHSFISHQQCDDPLVSSQKTLENCGGHVLCKYSPTGVQQWSQGKGCAVWMAV